MKKLFYLILLVSLLLKFYYNGECVRRNYDSARITQYGVYCYSKENVFKPYKPLRDIEIYIPPPANETKTGTT